MHQDVKCQSAPCSPSHLPPCRAAEACLTDSVQLRWIKQDRAVDTTEASASARSITPPTAATPVRRLAAAILARLASHVFKRDQAAAA
jgi:hypothetical protein